MLHYRTYKHNTQSPWVVFIHGAGSSSSLWYMQIKDFRQYFNVLLIDLRGHGKSASIHRTAKHPYHMADISQDIIEVLDYLNIPKAHFVGISLGTIIIRQINKNAPGRISSMIMGDAIIRLNLRAKTLIVLGNLFKCFLPYMWMYKFFARIIMPRAPHKKSRCIFINEAKKVAQKEFMRWFRLTRGINPLLRYFEEQDTGIPILYLMGEEDYMFLPTVEYIAARHHNSQLEIIEKSGHVCNIDQPEEFNRRGIRFLRNIDPRMSRSYYTTD